jgi:glycosyltransferase involved in cell wall biosynthesis
MKPAGETRLVAYTDADAFGGAERCLAAILAGLPSSFRVTILATSASVAEAIAEAAGGAESAVVAPPKRFWDARAVVSHRKALHRLRPDICLVNLRIPYACVHGTLAAVSLRGARVVAVEHAPLESESRGARLLKRFASRRLAAHVAVSEATARAAAAAASLAPETIRVLPNGVPEPAGGVAEFELPHPVVGGVGRLEIEKGFDLFVDALEFLPGVRAAVAGDGRQREALEQRAQARGAGDRFTVLGWQDEIGPFLRSLDVFVLPSRFEGLSLALLEAMATGAAIVATDVGGTREAIVQGETGLLVAPESPEAIAAGVQELLKDENLRKRLGARAREVWLERFTVPRMQEAYRDLLLGLTR